MSGSAPPVITTCSFSLSHAFMSYYNLFLCSSSHILFSSPFQSFCHLLVQHVRYPPRTVEALIRWSLRLPRAAIGQHGWVTSPQLVYAGSNSRDQPLHYWGRHCTEPRPVSVLTGNTAYLVSFGTRVLTPSSTWQGEHTNGMASVNLHIEQILNYFLSNS